ncbi:MAG: hypothetical protein M0R32_08415 [Candidatus Cloacimonetes bacterium]|jgi:hypothetical protein|nr:hypothetical protein [Candidatus Cloacimonadota bacterium]
MKEKTKQQVEVERAEKTIQNWETVPISELKDACRLFDSVILLLIQRMAI